MTLPIDGQIMDALAALLRGAAATEDRSDIAGVGALFLDAARVASEPDGVVIKLDQEGEAIDRVLSACQVVSTLPVVITITKPRTPGEPPNWRILGPFCAAVHARIMAGRRDLGGLCIDIESRGRIHEPNLQACEVRMIYTVTYYTAISNITVHEEGNP
jgi:hypothetical protein